MREFFTSNKFIIVITIIFSVIIVLFNIFDICFDETQERSYYREQIESMKSSVSDTSE